jgi:endonuclease G
MPEPTDFSSLRQIYSQRQPEPATEIATEAISPEAYDDRDGYNPTFLGAGSFILPLPLAQDTDDMVEVEAGARPGRPYELCYRRFSVVMNKYRRLCCVTGVNIDGAAVFYHPKRPGWRADPRIPESAQVLGPEFYVPTTFDRGHMVRRLDPVWGDAGEALQANNDTHHYTNSCPQVHSFNDVAWGDLEDWVLSQEQTRASKASVFTGPIFRSDDPVYRGVQVPRQFYKIIVVVDDETHRLSAIAFKRDQSADLPTGAETAFDPGRFAVDQLTLADLEQSTGLDLSALKPHDAFATHQPEEAASEIPVRRRLAGVRDAILWAQRTR